MERNYDNRFDREKRRNQPPHERHLSLPPHVDEDMYRGAYRFDNSSPHHNVSTYNWNERYRDERENRNMRERRQGTGHYNTDQSDYYRNRGYREDRPYRETNRQERGYWQDEDRHQPQSYQNARHISGNFTADYGPDSYGYGEQGENYGNMAGSLSYGYDGGNISDYDENRYYEPLTGHRRSYHGNYTSRHPENRPNQRDSIGGW
jgi:hypothetical protein